MDGLDMSLVDVSLNTDYLLEYRIVESNYEQFDSTTVELINKTCLLYTSDAADDLLV